MLRNILITSSASSGFDQAEMILEKVNQIILFNK